MDSKSNKSDQSNEPEKSSIINSFKSAFDDINKSMREATNEATKTVGSVGKLAQSGVEKSKSKITDLNNVTEEKTQRFLNSLNPFSKSNKSQQEKSQKEKSQSKKMQSEQLNSIPSMKSENMDMDMPNSIEMKDMKEIKSKTKKSLEIPEDILSSVKSESTESGNSTTPQGSESIIDLFKSEKKISALKEQSQKPSQNSSNEKFPFLAKARNMQAPNVSQLTSPSIPMGIKIGAIIVILCILGLNVFTFLAYGTDLISSIIKRGLPATIQGLRDTIVNAADGLIIATNKTSSTLMSATKKLPPSVSSSIPKKTKKDTDTNTEKNEKYDETEPIIKKKEEPDQIAKNMEQKPSKKQIDEESVEMAIPDNHNSSTIQTAKKTGYCYIGTDRGYRSCVKIEDGDQCMSGEIFPTMDKCINPKLR